MQSQNPHPLVPNQMPHTNTTRTAAAAAAAIPNTNGNTNSNSMSNINMNTGTNPRHHHPSQTHHNPSSKPPGQRHAHPPSKTTTTTNTHTHTHTNTSTNAPTAAKWIPHEERLRKAWRAIGNHIVHCMGKADALSRIPPGTPSQEITAKRRELDEAVVLFLRNRREYHHLLSKTEAKLTGKAEEMESLETYVRTQPRIGGRKRKR